MSEKHFTANVDLCTAGVCTELETDDATTRLNREHPTGTRHPWTPVATLGDGTPLPAPCPDDPKHKHYLFEC